MIAKRCTSTWSRSRYPPGICSPMRRTALRTCRPSSPPGCKALPVIDSDWPMRVHVRTFDLCDPAWREEIRDRVLAHVEPMERRHLREVKNWDIRPAAEQTGGWRRMLLPGTLT